MADSRWPRILRGLLLLGNELLRSKSSESLQRIETGVGRSEYAVGNKPVPSPQSLRNRLERRQRVVSSPSRSNGVTVEVCVTDLSGAITAEAAGAHRLELCSGLPLGGLTPGIGTLESVLAQCEIPVIVLIRPREGGFRYHENEVRVVEAELRAIARHHPSVAGFALGALTTDGDLDQPVLRRWLETAKSAEDHFELCLHRAFDHVRDAKESLHQAIDLGFDRILTSGLAPNAPDGMKQIAALVAEAAGQIEVMPGGGIDAEQGLQLVAQTGVRSLHLSGARWTSSGMQFQRSGIALGSGSAPDETRHLQTDGTRIEALLDALSASSRGTPGETEEK